MLLGLLDLKGTEFLNAVKDYDSEAFRELIHSRRVYANISRKKNAKTSNGYMDWLIYQARHVVENTFASLKHQRFLSNRYDKLLSSYKLYWDSFISLRFDLVEIMNVQQTLL